MDVNFFPHVNIFYFVSAFSVFFTSYFPPLSVALSYLADYGNLLKESLPRKRSELFHTKHNLIPARALGWKPNLRAGIRLSEVWDNPDQILGDGSYPLGETL